ncbi:hypothetical protein B566_EDAN017976 [Ephemera danica]|nr:hypothetical protein B566_EDAN017976 [Ephemera danica]
MNTYATQLLLNDKPHPFIIAMYKQRHPEFAEPESRLKSFEGRNFEIPNENLAEAGFYARDNAGENAWEEHAYWFRRCPYVLTVKGTSYVNAVIAKKKANNNFQLEGKSVETKVDPTCKVCLTNAADVLYLPCKHLASCRSCKVHLDKCPICRSKCDYIIVVYHT